MKKFFKIFLIVFLSLVIIFLTALGLFFLKFNIEIKKMSPLPTKTFNENLYSINNKFVNFFIIKSGEKYIAIDCGNDNKTTAAELQKLNINPENIIAVFLTHSHMDHMAGIKLFKNAEIYLSAQEPFNVKNNPYKLLQDNDTINILQMKIRCILTPGHTKGSMCYIIDDKLFTGDTLSLINGKAGLFNKFFNMNSNEEEKSIMKLSSLTGIKYIFTAHYGMSDDFNKTFK